MRTNKKMSNIFYTYLLVLTVVLCAAFQLQGAIPAIEREALIAFYEATYGDSWHENNGWKTPPLHSDGFAMPGTERNWYGITITYDHVTSIEVGGTQAGGYIPPEIANLKNLKNLGLFLDYLSGNIPPELGNLTNLECLRLSANSLNGSIPASLGNLTKLRYLELDNNCLAGTLPKELGNLTNLIDLSLCLNRLQGEIPDTFLDLQKSMIEINNNALYTNNETLRTFLNKKDPNWENSQTVAPSDVTVTPISPTSFKISWTPILYSTDQGSYRVFYRTPPANEWNYGGITRDKTVSSLEVGGLTAKQNYCFKIQTRTYPTFYNLNTVISLFSPEVCSSIGNNGPFGVFDTPLDNATISSSIAVTGWALDDFGVADVKIFWEPVAEDGTQGNGSLLFIGAANFVAGARPDVETTYPDYPNNNRAGWGYMLLSNTLPNGGNGTFRLHAIATDLEGNSTTLGIKTIVCDNIHAVKPFGAMDTPSQGGTASGHQFVNFGWVLTPLPNTIPTDGSTIQVWVDGVLLGNPVYNQYRADIATLFPGYANSLGAVGYFFIDTTLYKNGGHTIQWTATDNAGNTDGIGSRYFTIQNAASDHATPSTDDDIDLNSDLPTISSDDSHPVRVKTGYSQDLTDQVIYPDQAGTPTIKIPQLSRVEIDLNEGSDVSSYQWRGYLQVGKQKQPLPIGATLDRDNGVFYWQPCAGFLGQYHLVFEGRDQTKGKRRVELTVKIINE